MRRSPFAPAITGLLFFLIILWTACGKGTKSIPQPVTVTPTVSLEQGGLIQLSPTVLDQNSVAVAGFVFTFKSTSPTIADVSTSGGLVCGGSFTPNDSAPTACVPGTVGNTTITVSATNGKQSVPSATVQVFVHAHVTAVALTGGPASCVSQVNPTTNAAFQAIACTASPCVSGNSNDVTSTIGAFTWSVSPSAIGTVSSTTSSATVTAATPGQGSVFAAVTNGTNAQAVSPSATFTTCPVATISLSSNTGLSSLSATNTATLTPIVTDSNGHSVSTIPPLTYNSPAPVNVSVSNGTVTANSAGNALVTASCTPPSCNNGLYPVFSNGLPATVTGTTASTMVYATGTGTKSLVPISTGTSPPSAGTAITLGDFPNTFIMNKAGTKGYLGSESGLMVLDTSSNTVTGPTIQIVGLTGFVGTVLAVSPDGNWVVMAVHAEQAPGNCTIASPCTNTDFLFINTSSNAVNRFSFVTPNKNAVSADFSPDSSRAIVLNGDGNLYAVDTTAKPVPSLTTTPDATDNPTVVSFLSQGSFGIVAGGSNTNLSPFATCSLTSTAAATNVKPMLHVPTLMQPMPTNALNNPGVIAVSGSFMGLFTATTNGSTGFTAPNCTAGTPALSDLLPADVTFGPADINPTQIIVTPDGSKTFITGSSVTNPSTIFGWNLANPGQIAISLGATAKAGAVLPDSNTLYVGCSDSKLHVIASLKGAPSDSDQISLGFIPDLVVVQPK